MKNKFIVFLLFLCAFNILFCFTVKAEETSKLPSTVEPQLPINTIKLEESAKTIEIGKTIIINAIIPPDNPPSKELIWSTSDDKVATVDNNGSITALTKGTVIITVKTVDGTEAATCIVTVVGHKGWILENGKWYYYDYETNTKKTGWLLDSGVWYYLNSSGEMATDWQQINGNWYYLNPSGFMEVGWKQINGSWYYLNPNGEMKTGKLLYNETWYYLYSDGKMAINPDSLSSGTSYCIIIDSKNQAVNIFSGYANHWSFIRTMSCSSGASKTPTVKGLFKIQGRGQVFRAASNTICKYYTGFYGNYLFHSILLDNDGNVQDPTLGVPVSHGCVRLSIEDAKYINYNIPYDTTVWSN